MRVRFLLAGLLLFLAACSNPHDTAVPSDMSKWETELKPVIEKLPEEEKNLLAAYLIRMKMSEAFGGSAPKIGQTVGAAISEQKKWVEEQKAKEAEVKVLKERIKAERVALKKTVDETLTVAVVKLWLQKANYKAGTYSDSQVITLALQNKGTKDIKGIKGAIKFIDIFDKTIGTIEFGYDDGIPAGETRTWVGSRDYNQFLDEHKAIANLKEGKYTTRFDPEIIIFADGSKLKISE